MSNQSNVFGRAYEYICIETLNVEINKYRKSVIEKSSTYEIAKECWDFIDQETKDIFKQSALAATISIFDLEPMITEIGEDCLVLKMQKDEEGEIGDVRDIIIIRNAEKWEIGLSIKHNHLAVKHSRLGAKLDFGERWYGIKCSDDYWNDIAPIFDNGEALNILDYAEDELVINGEGRFFYNVDTFDSIIKTIKIKDKTRFNLDTLNNLSKEFSELLHTYQHITKMSENRITKISYLLNSRIQKLKEFLSE